MVSIDVADVDRVVEELLGDMGGAAHPETDDAERLEAYRIAYKEALPYLAPSEPLVEQFDDTLRSMDISYNRQLAAEVKRVASNNGVSEEASRAFARVYCRLFTLVCERPTPISLGQEPLLQGLETVSRNEALSTRFAVSGGGPLVLDFVVRRGPPVVVFLMPRGEFEAFQRNERFRPILKETGLTGTTRVLVPEGVHRLFIGPDLDAETADEESVVDFSLTPDA